MVSVQCLVTNQLFPHYRKKNIEYNSINSAEFSRSDRLVGILLFRLCCMACNIWIVIYGLSFR